MSELGNRLKEARLAKGYSLEQLQESTKIQIRYLVGIEEGNYSVMPGNFYTRAFIKQYAEAVNLSPEELFEEFKNEVPTTINDELPEKLSRVTSRKTMSPGNSKVFDILPTVLISILVIGLLVLVWYFLFVKGPNSNPGADDTTKKDAVYMASDKLKENTENENNEDTETEETPGDGVEEEEQTVEEETPKQEIIAVETNGRTTTYELKNADKFVVKIVALGKTWIDIKNGKDYSFGQAIIEKGATESKEVDLSQESEAYIIIGNSQVEIFVNDEKIELADSPSRQDIIIKYLKEGE